MPFSIPLTPDLPQSVVTPSSSISHTLVATLYPRDGPPVTTSHQIQLERHTSPSAGPISIDPVSMTNESPTTFTAQLPRSIFRVGESIPVYVTVAPPNSSVLSSGLRLRNIMIELWRHVKLGDLSSIPLSSRFEDQTSYASTSSSEKPSPSHDGATHSHVVTRSGSSCRFHSTRPLKMRFVIHESSAEPLTSGNITQTTLLHHVSFEIQVKISFTSSVSQNASEVLTRIPIVILPPLAPEPVGDMTEEIEIAYHKKHDPPPASTARIDDLGEGSSRPPAFDEVTSSSTSVLHPPYAPVSPGRDGASPPSFFEANHQDLPAASTSVLPAFSDGEDASGIHESSLQSPTSPPSFDDVALTPGAHLPSFIESQVEAHSEPSNTRSSFQHWVFNPAIGGQEMHFEGEGSLYGFHPSEQYDGISHSLMQSNAEADARINTAAAVLGDGDLLRTNLPALTEALAQYADVDENDLYISYVPGADGSGLPPPPPPLMDDPSDPPPSIDEGVSTLTEAERSRRERAIAEAAASAATTAVVRLNLTGTSLGYPHTNHGEGGEIADLSTSVQAEVSHVHLAQERLIPGAGDDMHVEDTRGGVLIGSVEESHPPPYLGAGAHGPPPYVD